MEIKHQVFDTIQDLSESDFELYQVALIHTAKAYAPYSRFKVCAVVKMSNGIIHYSCNHENAAYPDCICAEQSLISYVNAHRHDEQIESLGIIGVHEKITHNAPTPPCGSCRQVIAEMEDIQGSPIRILLFSDQGMTWVFDSIKDILPYHFNKNRLLG